MKTRHIKKRTLGMMQHFLNRHWKLEKETNVREVFQSHHNFMLRMHK